MRTSVDSFHLFQSSRVVNSDLSADQVVSMKVHLVSDLVLVFSSPQEPAATAEDDDGSDNSQFTGSTINLQDLE